MSWPVPTIRIGLAVRRRGRPARPRGSSGPIRRARRSRNSWLNDVPRARASSMDAWNAARSSGWMSRGSARRSAPRPPGSRPCCSKIASDQTSSPVRTSHSQKPVPDAASTSSRRSSRRSMSSAIAATSASDVGQPIARRPRARRSRRTTTTPPSTYSPSRARSSGVRIERAVAVGPDEDDRFDDRRSTTVAASPPREPADPGGDDHGAPVRTTNPVSPPSQHVERRP